MFLDSFLRLSHSNYITKQSAILKEKIKGIRSFWYAVGFEPRF
jgi:hypothetical protein